MITAREIVRALGGRNGSAHDDINPFLTISSPRSGHDGYLHKSRALA